MPRRLWCSWPEPAQLAGLHAERGHVRGRPGRGRRGRGADVRRGRGSDRHCRGCHGHGHGHEGGVRGGRRGEWLDGDSDHGGDGGLQ